MSRQAGRQAGGAYKHQAYSAHSWRPRKSNASGALSDLPLTATLLYQFFILFKRNFLILISLFWVKVFVRSVQGFWWGSLRERDHLGDPGVDGRIILRWIFRKWDYWRGERSLRVYENRVLRLFGPKRNEITEEWRKLHYEELSDLYSLPNIVRVVKSRRMRWAGHVACMGEGRGVYRVMVGKPEGKRPLGRPRRRWEDNIKMDLQEVGFGVRTGSPWLRIVTAGGHLWVR